MAIWKEPSAHRRDDITTAPESTTRPDIEPRVNPAPVASAYAPVRSLTPTPAETKEAILTAGLTIEGKIEGSGHIRIAGRFNGDVNVQGNLTIEPGARVVGGVTAETVSVAGELEGNIMNAARVELLESGVLTGDLKAGSLTVAAGSRMRGRVEFGWGNETPAVSTRKGPLKMESASAS